MVVKCDMEFFNRRIEISQAKSVITAAALFSLVISLVISLVSCASFDTNDSPSNRTSASNSVVSSFVPQNTDGNPQLITGNNLVDSTINQQLTDLVNQWICPAEGESQFNIERYSLSDGYLSIQYSAMQLCGGMPSPNSADGAVTFSLADGAEITLESLTQCDSIEQIRQQAGNGNIKARIEGCPAPEFSGNFFIDENSIFLLNFYPAHNDIGCEFEMVKTLTELMCQ